ncbi:hypothetical protein FSP39_016256 [Pinctada imbricata]|uniref:Uridine diphosphate glucose pyrophosphatase NUDT14 n=1 Tax=Pinctada imbricata TaxID=66713 RepID=A0AA88Y519_PINIB|nr:hypothetical protein FSP39_016256 [Pinctada imbricata]
MEVHGSVAIVILNKSRNVMVFVKQFRPAIYICEAELVQTEEKDTCRIDTQKYPGSNGITYELCAGIIDKDVDPVVIAQGEILEECGYKVPIEQIEKITSYRSGVGVSGSRQHLFYAEVTDDMKVGQGGGVQAEGEMIDVVEIPVDKCMDFVMDEEINRPVGMMFAIMWFFENKYKRT